MRVDCVICGTRFRTNVEDNNVCRRCRDAEIQDDDEESQLEAEGAFENGVRAMEDASA